MPMRSILQWLKASYLERLGRDPLLPPPLPSPSESTSSVLLPHVSSSARGERSPPIAAEDTNAVHKRMQKTKVHFHANVSKGHHLDPTILF